MPKTVTVTIAHEGSHGPEAPQYTVVVDDLHEYVELIGRQTLEGALFVEKGYRTMVIPGHRVYGVEVLERPACPGCGESLCDPCSGCGSCTGSRCDCRGH